MKKLLFTLTMLFAITAAATGLVFESGDKVILKDSGRHATILSHDDMSHKYTIQFQDGSIWEGALGEELTFLKPQRMNQTH